jgi:signal transduction histidine kinase
MEQLEVGCLLVRENEQLAGICTERDVIRCLATISASPKQVRVGEIMTRQIISCSMDTSIAKAQLIMAAHGIRHLPVVEHGRPVGMISSRDILASKLQDANRALEESAEEAQRARGAKDEMLSAVSHELRTPLNGILGMTELALETALDAEQREYLAVVRHSAEELDTAIRTLLDFKRIENGLQTIEKVPFDPQVLLRTTLSILARRVEAKGLDFRVEIEPLPERILSDPGRLVQVLNNLVDNAVKFTPAGKIEVQVRQLARTSRSARLGVAVVDTGIGIESQRLDRIFEAFAQGHCGDTRPFGGTGLGLTLSARLVGLMGGQLTVDSTPGTGSTFRFAIEAALPDGQPAPRQTDAARDRGLSIRKDADPAEQADSHQQPAPTGDPLEQG